MTIASTDHSMIPNSLSFENPERWLRNLDAETVAEIAIAAGDLILIIDDDGRICDIAGQYGGISDPSGWVGRDWAELVTIESRPKVLEMLSGTDQPRWRQVNHTSENGDLPYRYFVIPLAGTDKMVAIGRDVRAAAALQQRLLRTQQSLERDYLRLRQAEARYRLLFETTAEAMIIIDAASRQIREINPAARRMFGDAPGNLSGQPLASRFMPKEVERVAGVLGAISAGAEVSAIEVELAGEGGLARLSVSAFRQGGANFFLLRLASAGSMPEGPDENLKIVGVVERMPDAFVLAGPDQTILTANTAFVEAVHAVSVDQLRGRTLSNFIGRPGIDLELILLQLTEHESVRNVSTILHGVDGGHEEVELSAVQVTGTDEVFGFSIRIVGRRVRDLPPAHRDLPRSVEQLTDLVGRMPLKDIVRESTDLIERLCIEAALTFTTNNRASAAEILGLSRQSLYSKLHRHGLVRSDSEEG